MNVSMTPNITAIPPFTPNPATTASQNLNSLLKSNPTIHKLFKPTFPSLITFATGDLASPRLLILSGPPGCGKTYATRAIAKAISNNIIKLSGPELKVSGVGRTAEGIERQFKGFNETKGTVVIIDEADALFGGRDDNGSDATMREATSAILPWLDASKAKPGTLFVIFTSNTLNFDQALLSRADHILRASPPTGQDLRASIAAVVKKYALGGDEMADYFYAHVEGLTIRDIDNVAKAVRQSQIAYPDTHAATESFHSTIKEIRTRQNASCRDIRFRDVALPAETKQKIISLVNPIINKEHYKSLKITLPVRPMLLVGPPGTGKTLIAQSLAREVGGTFIDGSAARMKAGFVGQSPQKIKNLFNEATARSPAVIFIDEIDCLASSRTGPKTEAISDEVLSTLLTEIDGVAKDGEVRPLIIAATNFPDRIDPGIRSRFTPIEIGLPDFECRMAIIMTEAKKIGIADTNNNRNVFEVFARNSQGYSGRDIAQHIHQNACQWAQKCIAAKRQITFFLSDKVTTA